MPRVVTAAALVVACAVACAVCVSADTIVPVKLTLSDALSVALGTNAKLKEAESSYLTALSNSKIANLKTSADFGSEASLDRSPGSSDMSNLVFGNLTYASLSGTEAKLDLSPFAMGTKRGSVGLSLKRPLMQGRGILSGKFDKVQSAKSGVAVQNKQLYLAKQNTVIRVTAAYYHAVQAREQVKIQENAVAIAKDVAESARKRVAAKYAAGIEETRSAIRVAQRMNQLSLQQQAAKGALESLMLAIGAGVGETPELIDPVPGEVPQTGIPTLDEALKAALANRAELTIADEQLANQERQLAITNDRLRPNLDLVAGFNSMGQEAGLISRSLLDLGAFATGLQYRVPLDRRAMREEKEIAQRELEILKRLRAYQLDSIAEEVGRAYRSVQSNRASLEIFSQSLKDAQENLVLANRMMDEANGTNRDVLEAQEALTQTEGSILSARIDLYLAVLNLKNAMGEDLVTTGQQ